jgi:hypothetical protein
MIGVPLILHLQLACIRNLLHIQKHMAFHLSRSTAPERRYRGDVDDTVSFIFIDHFDKYGILRRNSIFGANERKHSRIKAERKDMAGGKKTPEIEDE